MARVKRAVTQPAVILDANIYRSLDEPGFVALLELERGRQVARFGEPFSVTELLTHLADPQDPDFAICRWAIVRVVRRCGGEPGDSTSGMIRDSESRCAELITGRGLPDHDAHTDQVCIMINRIANTPIDQPLMEEETSRLPVIAAHVAAIEAHYAETWRWLQQVVATVMASAKDEAERQQLWREVIKTHESEGPRRQLAEGLLKQWYTQTGLPLPDPVPVALVSRVLKAAAAWIEFEARLLNKVAFANANVDSSRIRNLRWDQRIAFNIGQSIGQRPVWLVTNDREFAPVAKAVGHEDRVYTLAAYEKWLRAT